MSALGLLIAVSVGMGLVGVGAFVWALRDGQFEDMEGAAHRILAPEDEPEERD
ncbi:cbb3-type cytochrome oxidase assembly protein CcoS [Roseicyclus sp.]|uniref:cbb3-type cytochrome oxidase assembly protein CcoS n=1 Tax=Roseicyclus sp. TaxID=1914329 RepID=UPI003F9FA1BE